jgi:hypothetical protein
MADAPAPSGTQSEKWLFWHGELEQARKVKGYDQWQTRAKKIIKRYRDERSDAGDTQDSAGNDSSRFNILWSNVQTLMPALFSKTPKPVVQRRYLDSDDVGRTATVILERALMYELDDGLYAGAMRRVVLDRLLPGRGVAWVRYEPRFTPMPGKTQEAVEDETAPAEQVLGEDAKGEEGEGEDSGQVEEEVASESTPIDYIDWKDFDTSPARTWEECWWISKTVHMTRAELVKRWPKIGAKIPLDYSPSEGDKQQPGSNAGKDQGKRAKIKEIWNKRDRKVIWLSESWSEDILEEKPDPLKLEGFYPTPRPLFATLTNDSLIPVPDFYEYQDQATELDDLTARIAAVTKAIKVAGVYDASVPELSRMFEEGFENRLVPCDNMAEFAQKAGATGMGSIWLLPVKDLVQVLTELYVAREAVKQSLYEITGISDIVRGAQSTGGAKTATEQRIKGQFASMRLNDMQAEVSRFARDLLRIMGEIISEHFDPMTLFMISGYEQWAKDQWPPEDAPQPPMMGHNGGPPMGPPQAPGAPPAGMQPGMMAPDPAQIARQKAAEMFQRAVKLLKDEKLRGFRIEIETDSLIEADKQEVQKARSEFLAAVGQFLTQAVPLGQALPEFMPLLGKMLLFAVRGFSASRDLESAFEQMIGDLQKKAKNPSPPPPSPEQIKAESEKAMADAKLQQMNAQMQADKQRNDMQLAADQQKHANELEKMRTELEMKREEMNIKREELAMRQQELAMDAQAAQQKAALDAQSMDRKAEIEAAGMEREAQQGERSHELALETMEAKAEMAKKPKEKAA